MLILTRRIGERIMIGNGITVAILGVGRNQVRVGIEAPVNVAVHREEVFERIRAQQSIDRSKLFRDSGAKNGDDSNVSK